MTWVLRRRTGRHVTSSGREIAAPPVHLERPVRPPRRWPEPGDPPLALEVLDDERSHFPPFLVVFPRPPAPTPDLNGRTDDGERDGDVAEDVLPRHGDHRLADLKRGVTPLSSSHGLGKHEVDLFSPHSPDDM